MRVVLVLGWLGLCASAASADNTFGVCYGSSDRVECGVDADPEDAIYYAKTQCNYWSEKPCRELVRCTVSGWFIVAKKRGSGHIGVRCAAGKDAKKAATDLALSDCGADCQVESWWIGPPPPTDGANKPDPAEQARLEKDRLEKERLAKEEKDRLEKERLAKEEKDRLEKERLAKEEKDRLDKERIAKEEQARRDEAAKKPAGGAGSSSGGGALTAEQLREHERQKKIAQGFEHLREAQNTNRELGNSVGTVAGSVFAIEGGNTGTATTSRAFRVGFGFGGRFLPVMSNTTGQDVVEESTQSTGGGFAIDGRLEFWPRYRQTSGIGLSVEAGVGGMAMPGGGMYSLRGGLGATGYYGKRAGWSIEGELGMYGQKVGQSALLIGARVAGSGSYRIYRLGVGPSFCAKRSPGPGGFCDTKLYGRLLLDWTSAFGETRDRMGTTEDASGKLVRLGVASKRAPFGVGLELELGFDYPAPGTTNFAIQPGDDRYGTYFGFLLKKEWTWHRSSAPSRRGGTTTASPDTSERVWGSYILGYSSQRVDGSASEADGAVDVYPWYGPSPRAWAPSESAYGDEHIDVGFIPRRMKQVTVYETYNPGAVRRIEVSTDTQKLIVEGGVTTRHPSGAAETTFTFSCTNARVTSVRVVLDARGVDGRQDIDAVSAVPCW